MILRLRLQFVAIAMALVTLIFLCIFGVLQVVAASNLEAASQSVLERVIYEENPSTVLTVGETRLEMPYFTVNLFQKSGEYTVYITGGTYDDLENTQALTDIISQTLSQNQEQGVVEAYNLRYLRINTGFVQRLAFVDQTMEQVAMDSMLGSFFQVLSLFFVLLLIIAWVLSGLAVGPMERAWKQQRQFLSDASHELKTPLTVILSNAQLLDDVSLEGASRRWVENIYYESQVMKTLVEQMLTLAQADQSMGKPKLDLVSLWDIVTDSVVLFEATAFEAGKPIEEDLCHNVLVLGQEDRLRQLLAILLDNAIKYGAPGVPITVRLTRTEKVAKLVVANQGEVIPPVQLSHLFERFYRSDASRGEQMGFGLGLSIASTIAKDHKATLRAESDEVSTRFIFTIPIKRARGPKKIGGAYGDNISHL